MRLRIRQRDYEAMLRRCEEAYPAEACGILLGTNAGDEHCVIQIVACLNAENDPSRRYSIDPLELVRVQRQARDRELQIVGFYHSHPDHPARPSPTDLECAHWISSSYVITSVAQGRAIETKSFLLAGTTEENKHLVEEIVLIEAES
jgi:proteasome lid subunit RPN8/RPN11